MPVRLTRRCDFLQRLADRGRGDRLASVHEAAREHPGADAGLDRPLEEHDPAVHHADRAGGDLGVEVEDEVAGLAHQALRLGLLEDLPGAGCRRSAGRTGSPKSVLAWTRLWRIGARASGSRPSADAIMRRCTSSSATTRSRSRAATVPFFVDRLAGNARRLLADLGGRVHVLAGRLRVELPDDVPWAEAERRAGRSVRRGELLARARSAAPTSPPSSARPRRAVAAPWCLLVPRERHGGPTRASLSPRAEIERELGAAIHVATGIPRPTSSTPTSPSTSRCSTTASSTRSSASPERAASRSAAPAAWRPCSRAGSTRRWRPGA